MIVWVEKVGFIRGDHGLIDANSIVRVKCLPTDTVGDLKRLIAAQTGTTAQKIQLKKWFVLFLCVGITLMLQVYCVQRPCHFARLRNQ